MTHRLTLPQALFLLARDDATGKPLGHYNMYIQPAGAITELVMMERLELMDDKWPKLNVLSTAPTGCLLYTSPSPRDQRGSRMPSSA